MHWYLSNSKPGLQIGRALRPFDWVTTPPWGAHWNCFSQDLQPCLHPSYSLRNRMPTTLQPARISTAIANGVLDLAWSLTAWPDN
jgi:hypothetical protein